MDEIKSTLYDIKNILTDLIQNQNRLVSETQKKQVVSIIFFQFYYFI